MRSMPTATELSVERRDSTRTCRSRALTCRLCAASAPAPGRCAAPHARAPSAGVPRSPAAPASPAARASSARARRSASCGGGALARDLAGVAAAVALRAAATPRRGCAPGLQCGQHDPRACGAHCCSCVLGGLALALGLAQARQRAARERRLRLLHALARPRAPWRAAPSGAARARGPRHAGRCRGSRAAIRARPTRPRG